MKEWKETRLKNLLAIPLSYGLNVSSDEDREDWPRYIRITDFDDYNKLDSNTFKSLPLHIAEPALLEDGDLLFARSGATVGKTFLYTQLPNGACYAGYLIRARFNKKSVLPKFVSYFTKGEEYNQWKNKYCIQTTIENISADKYNQLPLCIPSLQVQQRIVEYLEAKTTEIDKKIELLGKKRDTYKRLKIATINHAVTRGLDEHVPLKDSGMDWIGQIPEHWDVKRTKDVCSSIFTGATPSTTNEEYWDGDIPWIPSGCCHDCYINEAPKFITQEGFANSSTRWIPSGTTVMAITGATCAQLGTLMIDACANQSVVAFIENKKKLDARYLFYVLRSERGIILTNRTGGAQAGVDTGDCMKILICVPPLSEQKQIAAYLDERCAKIDAAVTIIDKQIDALKRLKRSLINEVVTGKRMV